MRQLAAMALDTAVLRGAEYADVRLVRYRRQNLSAEDNRLSGIADTDDYGLGVRVLVDGAWGFAGTGNLTREEVQRVAAEAVAIARASAAAMREKVRLVPEPARTLTFRSPCEVDPFSVSIGDKAALLLTINARLLNNKSVRKAQAFMTLRKDERLFLSTDGSDLSSEVVTTAAGYQATAVGDGDARSRSYMPPPLTRGYENINAEDLLANTERVAEQAVMHLNAPECPVGYKDLILDPQNLSLTIHESVGHATELDRALGYEESLAGRSFATPDKLRNLKYGSDLVSFVADNTLEAGLATQGFDDDGVTAQRWHIVEDGLFVGYSTGREVAGHIGLERSTGGCRADHWGSIPIVRIPNLSLMPGKEPLTLEELISDTDDGIFIEGRGSFSIDQMRCNFQFGGDAFWEIKKGRIVGMLKNVTYQSMTTDFWGSCDAICDARFWVQDGVLNCGKGDPMQIAQMTHGAAPARFRHIKVGAAR
ncbi:MAG: TldD/PmbA family protein [Chthonomonadales bacterium]|nr:TldD/PmbA family protein [Chthonomonadales bacterium]